jgi:hypothetical protein
MCDNLTELCMEMSLFKCFILQDLYFANFWMICILIWMILLWVNLIAKFHVCKYWNGVNVFLSKNRGAKPPGNEIVLRQTSVQKDLQASRKERPNQQLGQRKTNKRTS